MKHPGIVGMILLLGVVASPAACGRGGDADGHWGHGVVRQVDVEESRVTIEHGDIPGLMKGMTMTFEVADPDLLEGQTPGRKVHFRVEEQGGIYRILELQ